jgi:hypothetical protein
VEGGWPEKIKVAALAAIAIATSPDLVIALLTDVREIMHGPNAEKILTANLLTALKEHPEPSADWRTIHRGGPINENWLREAFAGVLFPPGSQSWWIGKRRLRGYKAEQFTDAYERYAIPDNYQLPPENTPSETQDSAVRPAPPAPSPKKSSPGLKEADGAGEITRPAQSPAPSESDPLQADGAGRGAGGGISPAPRKKRSPGLNKSEHGAGGADEKRHVGKYVRKTEESQPPVDRVDETW